MREQVNRRGFLKQSALASAAAVGISFEEQALLAQAAPAAAPGNAGQAVPSLPRGKLGKLSVTRLICGGNLISGFAHSRDLIYVSPLLKHYFTDAKILETLALCEKSGINTMILRLDDDTLRVIRAFRQERRGKLQWIAQVKLPEQDRWSEIKRAIDAGAEGVYIHGGVGDELVKAGQVEILGQALEVIKKSGVTAGLAGHQIAVPMACEKAGLKPDFYMKTFNSKSYWSAGPKERRDNLWEENPQATKAFMAEVDRPWIAYKVLGAGAIQPREGFAYAFENGADFLCVGMFDFQVVEDVQICRNALDKIRQRERPWF
jgi:hypothetical protein